MSRSLKASLLGIWLVLFGALSLWTGGLTASLVGQPFSGFLVQPLLYVSPYQIPSWQVGPTGLTTMDHVVAVEGRPVPNGQALLDAARAVPVGTPLRYEVTRQGMTRAVYVPTRLFTWMDWADLYGFFLALAWEFAAIGLAVWWLRPDHPGARTLAVAMGLAALVLLIFPDYNSTHALPLAWMFCFYLMGSAFMALALRFPQPPRAVSRAPWLGWVPWGVGAALATAVCAQPVAGPSGMDAGRYALVFTANAFSNVWMALGLLMLLSSVAWHFARSPGRSLPRRQAGFALVGGLLAFTPMLIWTVQYSLRLPQSVPLGVAFSWSAIFPAAIAMAIARGHLFDIRLAVRRSLTYLLLSALLAGVYVLATIGLRLFHVAHLDAGHLIADLAATALVVILAVPLRDMLQGLIDRGFFREAYDAEQALAEASQSMITLLERDAIVERMAATVKATMHPLAGALLLAEEDDRAFLALGAWGSPAFAALPEDHALFGELATHPVLARHADAAPPSAPVSAALESLGAEVAIAVRFQGRLLGVLLLGPKQADTAYSERDLRLLRTLANQSAIALENARGVRRLQAFNVELEAKVASRTAEVEHALSELKAAQAMLVHAEKMAALGLLVGGVAHELNNPLTFITGSLELMEERLAEVQPLLDAEKAGASEAELARLREAIDPAGLRDDLATLLGACREGAERARAIVQSLRDFSRLDEFERQPVDLAAGLVSTVALVKPAFKDRVAIELELAAVPPVAGSLGHLNQVFMNILMNACQAIEGAGTVRVRLGQEGEAVVVTIADTGVGMSEAVRSRIFEPFYTTKPLGQGTGLGLAICLGILEKHGGRVEVDSAPGEGTEFRLIFPLHAERTTGHAHHSDR